MIQGLGLEPFRSPALTDYPHLTAGCCCRRDNSKTRKKFTVLMFLLGVALIGMVVLLLDIKLETAPGSGAIFSSPRGACTYAGTYMSQ